MARASSPTLLSLDRFAEIFGINPVHFSGAYANSIWPRHGYACDAVWPQHPWQTNKLVSREEVARAIRNAEFAIAQVLGYWPAPTWTVKENHAWPRQYNRAVQQGYRTAVGRPVTLNTKYQHVIGGGRRASEAIESEAAIVYTDEDGDDFYETATLTVYGVTCDISEIRIYTAGKSAHPAWEIRGATSSALENEIYTAVYPSWLFIEPTLWEAPPNASSPTFEPINVTTTDNFVDSVDVYRVWNDTSQASALLSWASTLSPCSSCLGVGCNQCTQEGCMVVLHPDFGTVGPTPATYSEDDARWNWATPTAWRDPDHVDLWYYSGYRSSEYLSGLSPHDPLDAMLAQAIAEMAMARLTKPVCSCSNLSQRVKDLREDFALSSREHFVALPRDGSVYHNPFGTKVGEVNAWRIVGELVADAPIGGI